MLRAAFDKTIETDDLKSSFLLYMTNQMSAPAESIDNSVTTLCNHHRDLDQQQTDSEVDNIQKQTRTMVGFLNHIAHFTKTDTGKEAAYA